MTPENKAKELVNKICKETEGMFHAPELMRSEWVIMCKQCALISVDEIILNTNLIEKQCLAGLSYKNNIEHWQQVKKSIINLK